nr:MAG TPA: Inovirus G7P protein [Inoviridae sp.]
MSNEIEITTKFCHPYMNFGGDGCDQIVLKIPQTEAEKLVESAQASGNENQNFSAQDFIHHVDSFGFSFGLVLIFYLIAKSIGSILAILR